jgi:hypothetical protein
VHRRHGDKTGNMSSSSSSTAGDFVLEPAFCIADSASITNSTTHFDPLTGEHYLSFPLLITHESLVSDVMHRLTNITNGDGTVMSVKSLTFMEVRKVSLDILSSRHPIMFGAAAFEWRQTSRNQDGILYAVCGEVNCSEIL